MTLSLFTGQLPFQRSGGSTQDGITPNVTAAAAQWLKKQRREFELGRDIRDSDLDREHSERGRRSDERRGCSSSLTLGGAHR